MTILYNIEYPVFELFAQLNPQIECQLMNILEFEKKSFVLGVISAR